jgi:hypothetical protein
MILAFALLNNCAARNRCWSFWTANFRLGRSMCRIERSRNAIETQSKRGASRDSFLRAKVQHTICGVLVAAIV